MLVRSLREHDICHMPEYLSYEESIDFLRSLQTEPMAHVDPFGVQKTQDHWV